MKSNETTVDDLVGEELADVLRGVDLKLFADLADLDGSTVDDLTVTLQIMPFGDRAVLKAYGCVDKNHEDRYIALPKLVELTHAAHVVRDYLSDTSLGDAMKFLHKS